MNLSHDHITTTLVCLALLSACSGNTHVVAITPSTVNGMIDDFEDASFAWKPGMWPEFSDSSATRVVMASQHVTHANHALQLDFEKRDLPKAIFFQDRNLDLSTAHALAFDLYNNDGAAGAVAIALRSAGLWQESQPFTLKPGPNAVHFDLAAASFKTDQSSWQYNTGLVGLRDISEIAIIVFPNKNGSVTIDKLVSSSNEQTATSPASVLQGQRYITMRPSLKTVQQYRRQDFDIDTDIAAGNPFDPAQIAIDIQLNSPSGEVISVPAFVFQKYAPDIRQPVGLPTWKARFTPTQEGDWTAKAVLNDGKSTIVSDQISFTVLPAVSRGFVRTNVSNPQYLVFDNNEAFFPIGINLGWGHEDPLKDYARWFDALQKNGANVARIWMASWSFGIEWKDLGLGRYRLDRAWLLDKVMQMAEERGIYVILVLINHGAFNIRVNPEWVDNPYNAEQGGPCKTPEDFATNPLARKFFEQRLRYIAARWAYSPNLLAWEWWNEVNLTPLDDPNLLRPWLKEMTAYLHTVDPYHHLTSISYADANDPRITSLPELDVLQRHLYSPLDPRISIAKAYSELISYGTVKLSKPTLFTEFGYSGASEQPSKFDAEGIQFHNGLWASTFSGFASAAMYWWWDSYIEPNNYWYHLKGLANFLADQDLSTLNPTTPQIMTTTVQASALGRDDRALIWLRSSSYSVDAAESQYRTATLFGNVKEADWRFELLPHAAITLTLSGMQNGTYHVAWYDTRTSELVASNPTIVRDGNLTFTAPTFDRDLAAKVMLTSP